LHSHSDKEFAQAVEDSSTSPIILTGRGGSGTRLLSLLAQSNNIFLGNELNETADSVEWKDLIYELSVGKLNRVQNLETKVVSPHHHKSDSSSSDKTPADLLDMAVAVLSRKNWSVGQAWGWKLPESMLLVPELMETFPKAKLIHLVRHPVTSSLRRSHKTSRPVSPVGRSVLNLSYTSLGLDESTIHTDEDYLRNAITWRYQVDNVTRYAKSKLDQTRYLQIQFEDICQSPEKVQRDLCDFVGIEESNTNVPEIDIDRIGNIDADDSRVDKVWEICRETAINVGYTSMEKVA